MFFCVFNAYAHFEKNMVPKVAMCSCTCFPDPRCATIASFYLPFLLHVDSAASGNVSHFINMLCDVKYCRIVSSFIT